MAHRIALAFRAAHRDAGVVAQEVGCVLGVATGRTGEWGQQRSDCTCSDRFYTRLGLRRFRLGHPWLSGRRSRPAARGSGSRSCLSAHRSRYPGRRRVFCHSGAGLKFAMPGSVSQVVLNLLPESPLTQALWPQPHSPVPWPLIGATSTQLGL